MSLDQNEKQPLLSDNKNQNEVNDIENQSETSIIHLVPNRHHLRAVHDDQSYSARVIYAIILRSNAVIAFVDKNCTSSSLSR